MNVLDNNDHPHHHQYFASSVALVNQSIDSKGRKPSDDMFFKDMTYQRHNY